jgi:ribonuclease-3
LRSKRSPDHKVIARRLGVRFRQKRLLLKALTHSSSVQDRRHKSNENLEFLGDAVLELVVREHLFKQHPRSDEGRMSEMKKAYTSEDALAVVGRRLGIGRCLVLDRGELQTGGRTRRSNITGAVEALIGALYLDRGLEYARRFIRRTILGRRVRVEPDYKSLLNNLAMRRQWKLDYRVLGETGPAHEKVFDMGLYVNRKLRARGRGQNKKKAEQAASKIFFKKIKN